MIRFKHNIAGWDIALVLRSYMCDNVHCCVLGGYPPGDDPREGQVIDILWNNGQRDTDYHLEGIDSNQLEVISE